MRDVLCRRVTGNGDLAGSWKRQTSATAKWVSIDFPLPNVPLARLATAEKTLKDVRLLSVDSEALAGRLHVVQRDLRPWWNRRQLTEAPLGELPLTLLSGCATLPK